MVVQSGRWKGHCASASPKIECLVNWEQDEQVFTQFHQWTVSNVVVVSYSVHYLNGACCFQWSTEIPFATCPQILFFSVSDCLMFSIPRFSYRMKKMQIKYHFVGGSRRGGVFSGVMTLQTCHEAQGHLTPLNRIYLCGFLFDLRHNLHHSLSTPTCYPCTVCPLNLPIKRQMNHHEALTMRTTHLFTKMPAVAGRQIWVSSSGRCAVTTMGADVAAYRTCHPFLLVSHTTWRNQHSTVRRVIQFSCPNRLQM